MTDRIRARAINGYVVGSDEGPRGYRSPTERARDERPLTPRCTVIRGVRGARCASPATVGTRCEHHEQEALEWRALARLHHGRDVHDVAASTGVPLPRVRELHHNLTRGGSDPS